MACLQCSSAHCSVSVGPSDSVDGLSAVHYCSSAHCSVSVGPSDSVVKMACLQYTIALQLIAL